jgi:hypothetical protein
LIKLQKTLPPVEKKLNTFKLNLGVAKAYAKKEKPTSWLAWSASKAYEFKDTIWSAWEGKFDDVAKGLTEKGVDYLIKKFSVPENVVVKV